MKPTLWIVSELFYPNESATAYILTQMALAFTEAYEVKVICADSNYEHDNSRVASCAAELPGITVRRVKVPEWNKNSLPGRLLRLLSTSRILYREALRAVRPGDTVFAVTNPALLLLHLERLRRRRDFRYILLVHDVFPENAFASGVAGKIPLKGLLKKRFDRAYAAADKVLVLGEDMKEVVAAKTGRPECVFVCENWGEEEIVPRPRQGGEGIVLQYAGNIGRVQGLEQLVSLLPAVENKILTFDFWGSGALVPFIANFAEKNPCCGIRLRGSYNRAMQTEVLNSCDIAVISLARGMKGLGVPSKTYNILAAGKPILYIGDEGSDIYRLVRENDLGAAFDWDHTPELLEWLQSLTPASLEHLREQGKRSRALYESRFTKSKMLHKTLEIVSA